jgi:hypothetical protein
VTIEGRIACSTRAFTILYAIEQRPGGLFNQLSQCRGYRWIANPPNVRTEWPPCFAELSFDIVRRATLAQLVEQLCLLGEAHGGLPLSVNIRIAVESAH